ncbi:hypothetical protein D3C85_1064810 [compost metagenome]
MSTTKAGILGFIRIPALPDIFNFGIAKDTDPVYSDAAADPDMAGSGLLMLR